MKKMKFLRLPLCIACFFILLYGRWNVKNISGESNPDIAAAMNQAIHVEYAENSTGFYDPEAPTLSALEQETEIIIKATVLENRIMSARSTKTELCIREILSQTNTNLSVGDKIYLIEPVTFLRGEVYVTNGYQMAHTGEEYIFLLKHLECVEGYQYTKEQEIIYMPISVYYSKYATSYTEVIETLGSDKVLYDEIQNYAILTNSDYILAAYKSLINQINETYRNFD